MSYPKGKKQSPETSADPPVTVSENNNINHERGYQNGLYFRSSYERTFIEYCLNNGIRIESAETKNFRVAYKHDGRNRFYYPDFFLPDYDTVVEIKPLSRLNDDKTQSKIDAGAKRYGYSLVCEEELENLDEYFLYLS